MGENFRTALPQRRATLPLTILTARRIQEPDAGYLIRLERDWRAAVLAR
jgi:hypothetical protein